MPRARAEAAAMEEDEHAGGVAARRQRPLAGNAAEVDGLGFDPDDYRHRLAFVDVALYLEQLGVLRRLDGNIAARISRPHDEHPSALQHLRRLVSVSVQHIAGKLAGIVRHSRRPMVAVGDEHAGVLPRPGFADNLHLPTTLRRRDAHRRALIMVSKSFSL